MGGAFVALAGACRVSLGRSNHATSEYDGRLSDRLTIVGERYCHNFGIARMGSLRLWLSAP
jgi:hypothetical protein